MRMLMRGVDLASTLVTWVAGLLTVAMMLHVTADVIGRTVFNHPIAGTIEIVSGYYMAGLAFLPLAWITREKAHIIVELFTQGLSARKLLTLDAGIGILTLGYVVMFTWQVFQAAVEKTEIGEAWEAATGQVPIWPSRWVVPIGFGLMAVYLLVHIVRDLRAIREKDARVAAEIRAPRIPEKTVLE